jgi:hypothetical protein
LTYNAICGSKNTNTQYNNNNSNRSRGHSSTCIQYGAEEPSHTPTNREEPSGAREGPPTRLVPQCCCVWSYQSARPPADGPFRQLVFEVSLFGVVAFSLLADRTLLPDRGSPSVGRRDCFRWCGKRVVNLAIQMMAVLMMAMMTMMTWTTTSQPEVPPAEPAASPYRTPLLFLKKYYIPMSIRKEMICYPK